MIDSSSRSESEEEDTSSPFSDYENPNYRKLYATLSVTTMMGANSANGDTDNSDEEGENAFDETTKLNGNKNQENDGVELPEGWEKHEDDNGPYYWHIPSGTIQRQVPTASLSKRDSIYYFEDDGLEKLREEISKETILKEKFPEDDAVFIVNSLGWMAFDESQLTPELSSKAIKRCIIELSNQTENAVKCWGKEETKHLVLKIENGCLKLLDIISGKILTIQPIANIRVWGVNDVDDFAYVARDNNILDDKSFEKQSTSSSSPPTSAPSSPPAVPGLKCHVFHCDSTNDPEKTAQKIATLLKEEMIRIKSQSSRGKGGQNPATRPSHLSIDEYTGSPVDSPADLELPTPIEEPRKTIVARYLGKTPVPKPVGVEILNEAIDRIVFDLDRACPAKNTSKDSPNNDNEEEEGEGRGIVVLVHVSPSTVTVESTVDSKILVECRVRYLSFLGIGKNSVKNCGFILQVDDNSFEAHCFECEPSSGLLCKTIEAACKLRFQKCLDAHKQRCYQAFVSGNQSTSSSSAMKPSQSMGAIKNSLINAFSKILSKR